MRLVVEVDESLLARRKYHRGRLVRERWIMGGFCSETQGCRIMNVKSVLFSRKLLPSYCTEVP